MNILTHTKEIKVHTIQVDDTEVINYQHNPDQWLELLDSLLINKPEPNGDGAGAGRKKNKVTRRKARAARAARADGEMMACPKCGTMVKPRGLLIHQRGSKCRARAGADKVSAD